MLFDPFIFKCSLEEYMGRLKFEAQCRLSQEQTHGQEVIECGDEKVKERDSYLRPSIPLSLEDIEAIDIDDIAAILDCGRNYTVGDLVEQFGISVEVAESLLNNRSSMDMPNLIAENEIMEPLSSNANAIDIRDFAEPFDNDLLSGEKGNLSDEDIAQMVYDLEHAFD